MLTRSCSDAPVASERIETPPEEHAVIILSRSDAPVASERIETMVLGDWTDTFV